MLLPPLTQFTSFMVFSPVPPGGTFGLKVLPSNGLGLTKVWLKYLGSGFQGWSEQVHLPEPRFPQGLNPSDFAAFTGGLKPVPIQAARTIIRACFTAKCPACRAGHFVFCILI
jgi:hypothetical protein